MSAGSRVIERLFGSPGERPAAVMDLNRRAADAHERLIRRTAQRASGAEECGRRALSIVNEYLDGPDSIRAKRRLLCHPLLIEGLHALAPWNDAIRSWHEAVAPPGPNARRDGHGEAWQNRIGGVALMLLLRADPQWQGEMDLCTDAFGRMGFPGSDWTMGTSTDVVNGDAADARIPCCDCRAHVTLDAREAHWRLGDRTGPEFLTMDHDDFVRAFAHNDERLELSRLRFPDPHLRVRLQYARPFHHSAIRYDPIGFVNFQSHAGLTGGLVECLLDAMHVNTPHMHRELRALIHTVRGFEVSESDQGMIESFSDPTLPGVMGINICYGAENEVVLEPFFFTDLGHELGHTRHYLIETILHDAGTPLLRNPGDCTPTLPRYGRPLAVRTVFQVPFVHLYEWALLMDFLEADFRGLPWDVEGGWEEFGDDLEAEIDEAFGLIDDLADPTPLGAEALNWFRTLHSRARTRWHALKAAKPEGCRVL